MFQMTPWPEGALDPASWSAESNPPCLRRSTSCSGRAAPHPLLHIFLHRRDGCLPRACARRVRSCMPVPAPTRLLASGRPPPHHSPRSRVPAGSLRVCDRTRRPEEGGRGWSCPLGLAPLRRLHGPRAAHSGRRVPPRAHSLLLALGGQSGGSACFPPSHRPEIALLCSPRCSELWMTRNHVGVQRILRFPFHIAPGRMLGGPWSSEGLA